MIEEKPLSLPVREIQPNRSFLKIGLVFVFVAAGFLFYKYSGIFPRLGMDLPIGFSASEQPAAPQVSDMPASLPTESSADLRTGAMTTALPDLNESDVIVAQNLATTSINPTLQAWLDGEQLIRKTVAVIDNAARGEIARKVLDLPAPNIALNDGEKASVLTLSETDFARYNDYVDMLQSMNSATLRQLYRQFQPLLQQAYAELGNPNPNIDAALASAFQVVLDTPEINSPLNLQRIEGRLVFVDPALENLPDVQKLLIRAGPRNRARIKAKMAELQAAFF